jgi:membrane-bound lytic murein transglycosylase B
MRILVRTVLLTAAVVLTGCASAPEPSAGAATAQVLPAVGYATPSPRYAGVSGEAVLKGDYAGHPAVSDFIDRMVREEGFDRKDLARTLSRLERQQWILDFMNRPKGKPSTTPTGAWNRYRAKFITDANVSSGVRFWRQYADTLARAERTYGVPAEYVVAILGVETRWGAYMGKHRVVDALATLAFDYPRRSAFFTDELAAFLVMARDEGFDPFQPVGSYAGAMGLGQFMPSSFHNYAVDFDGDGHRDLWNPVDAIGSVANYFKGHGWRSGEPVVVRARAQGIVPAAMKTGFDSRYGEDDLQRAGILATAPVGGRQVSLIRLDAMGGYEYWLGLDNFYTITRYNHSSYYAMAVHQLAEELKARRGPLGPLVTQRERVREPAL